MPMNILASEIRKIAKELKQYKNSTEVPWRINEGTGHETYSGNGLRFNVDEGKRILSTIPHDIIPIDPKEWVYSDHFTGYKYQETKNSDLSIPVIVTEIRGTKFVLDGWHRLTKAFHENITSIPSVELTEKEAMQILLRKNKNHT
jgi:hypothetical protein